MDPIIANAFYTDGRIENDFYGDGGNVPVPRFRRQIIQRNPVTRLFTFQLSNSLIKIKLCYLSSQPEKKIQMVSILNGDSCHFIKRDTCIPSSYCKCDKRVQFRDVLLFFLQKLEEIDLTLATTPEEKKNLIRCPFCKQRNLRKNQDNHVRCWNCSRSGCFQCKRGIAENPVLKHFLPPNLCKQHAIVTDTQFPEAHGIYCVIKGMHLYLLCVY